MVRGELAVGLLPVLAVLAVVKIALSELDFQPLDINALLSGLVAANVFLLGFLLAGTLSDYKEAERLPADLAASLESIADEALILHEAKGEATAPRLVEQLRGIADGTIEWLEHRCSQDEVLDRLRELNRYFLALESLIQITFISRMKGEQLAIRRGLMRIETIRRTSFVGAGYVAADLTAKLVIGALLLTELTPLSQSVFFLVTIAFLLLYMNRLIRDLDNPFEYREGAAGSADVSLAPLRRAERRLREARDSMQPADHPAVAPAN